jgi:HEAT repeat protein
MKTYNATIIFALFCMTSTAMADTSRGMVLSPDALAPVTRAALQADVNAQRALAPGAFTAVDNVVREAQALDAEKRGRIAPFARIFKRMGDQVLLPLLEVVALDGRTRGDLRDSAWSALRAGAIQAIGSIRDSRAVPVMTAILASDEGDFLVRRETAKALGRMGTPAAAAVLLAESAETRSNHAAVLDGMGWCRRVEVAAQLSKQAKTADAQTLPHLLTALSDIGNGWAWKTSEVRENAEQEMQVREMAGKALLSAWMRLDGELAIEARKGLLVVDHPDTLTWIAQARTAAAPEIGARFDQLAERVKRSPFRR